MFRKIVKDSIINYDTSTWINNMNLAILDTAISPSHMIIQKIIIPGYNNMLRVTPKNMKFVLNKNINYGKSAKKFHQDPVKTFHTKFYKQHQQLLLNHLLSIYRLFLLDQ